MPPLETAVWVLHLPKELAAWIEPRPWLSVVPNPTGALIGGGRVLSLSLHPAPVGADMDGFIAALAHATSSSFAVTPSLRIITATYLRRSVREHLEKHGLSYLDAKGHLHLTAPGVLVHVDGGRARAPVPPGADMLGTAGTRLVQTLLMAPGEVSISGLAEQAHLSTSYTHRVLQMLEEAGHVRSSGAGPMRRRSVVHRGALLEWLSRQPAARRRSPRITAALYARTPLELWRRVRATLDAKGIAHALSGTAAASALGVGATAVPLSLVRIAPVVPLEDAAAALGAEVTERGANLTLMRDEGNVGTALTELHDDVRLAPRVRIYLDLLADRRGEDQAERFREVALGF